MIISINPLLTEYPLNRGKTSQFEAELVGLSTRLTSHPIQNETDLLNVVQLTIKNVLSHHIEDRHWIDPFWDGERSIRLHGKLIKIPRIPKSEPKIQPTIHVILHLALSILGIHVIRESDEGVGLLDFRCLYTTSTGIGICVGVEFKLAHHKQIQKGLRNQLPAYLKAISSKSGILCVMWFKDVSARYFSEPRKYEKKEFRDWLEQEAKQVATENSITLSTSVIDASIKPSASNL